MNPRPSANFAKVSAEYGLSTYEVLTLASIVEKEATASDKRKVASVFLNRIKKKMKLESCATLNYVLNKRNPHLSYKELKIDTPYNTYLHTGLPPTPICCFSINTLDAVLKSEKSCYLYFFTPDGRKHVFSKTYREHRAKILKYGVYGK